MCAQLIKGFPSFESNLKDQLLRSGRSPGACIAEAWRKRRYIAYWSNKLSDGMSEAGEAQWWLEVAYTEKYCTDGEFEAGLNELEKLIAQLAKMIQQKEQWTFSK